MYDPVLLIIYVISYRAKQSREYYIILYYIGTYTQYRFTLHCPSHTPENVGKLASKKVARISTGRWARIRQNSTPR